MDDRSLLWRMEEINKIGELNRKEEEKRSYYRRYNRRLLWMIALCYLLIALALENERLISSITYIIKWLT